MPEFQIDLGTSAKEFAALDRFTQGYIEAIFWLNTEGEFDGLTFDDLAPNALVYVVGDCADFQRDNAKDLNDIDDHQAGVDYWLTRNRHGAGYWDRGHGDAGKRLTEAAHQAGSQDAYVGDDGLIYLG